MKIQKPIICYSTNNPESLPQPSMTNHLLHLFTNFKVIQLGIDHHHFNVSISNWFVH